MSSVLSFLILTVVTRMWVVLASPIILAEYYMEEKGKDLEELPRGQTQIKILNLAYNRIQILPDLVFLNKSYKELQKIELYQNRIDCLQPQAFRGLRQLQSINLADNNLTEIDPYTFKFNPKLEKLDLSRNGLSFNRLNVFLISSSIEILILSENRIEQIFEPTFMGLPNVENLILDNNVLNTITSNSFKPLKKLQYLSLANTGVYRLSESMFSNNLPRIIDLQETPLAKKFDPPLKKITNNSVRSLMQLIGMFASDTLPH